MTATVVRLGPPPPAWKPPPGPADGLEQPSGSPDFRMMIPETALILGVPPTRLAAWRARGVGPRFCRATPAKNSAILYSRAEVDAVRADIDKALRAETKAENLARIGRAENPSTRRKRNTRR